MNGVNYGSNHVRTYKHHNSILFGVPPFIADQTMPNEELGVPGCFLGIDYSYEVGELLKQKYNASPAHWETLEYGGHPHPFLIYGDEYDFNAKNYHLIELTSNWY